jgi:hypothetical protein
LTKPVHFSTIKYGNITKINGNGEYMLEGLFGNPVVEKIFFAISVYNESYALGLAKTFNEPVNKFQQQLKRLEEGGIIVSRLVGRVRIYTFNPRYPFLKELKALISRAYEFVPEAEKEKFYSRRTRPRRAGKPL